MKHPRFLQRICILILISLLLIPTAKAYSPETLYLGQRGELVRAMQSGLKFVGYDIKVDGVFGKNTESAVVAFQKQNRLTADGLAGRKTLDVLYQLAPQFKPDTSLAQTPSGSGSSSAAKPVISETTTTPLGTMYVYTSNKGSLNLRNRPSHGNTTFAQLPFGTAVEVINTLGSWTQVKANGQIGYVVSSFLRANQTSTPVQNDPIVKPEAPPQPVQSVSGNQAQVVTANRGSLNLRNRASYSGMVLIQVPYLASVNVLSKSGSWSKISYMNYTGYVVSSYLKTSGSNPVVKPETPAKPEQPEQPNTNLPVSGEKATVNNATGRYLNFRSTPSQNNNIIGQIPSGTVLSLVSKGNDWCEVVFNGSRGYVMTSFLKFDAKETPAEPAEPAVPQDEDEQPLEEEVKAEATFPRVLKAGLKGADVKELQTRLAKLKYTVSINSVYDAMTKEAVTDFQKQNYLKADGIFGSESAGVLLGGSARLATDPKLSFATLRIDNSNSAVTKMQEALKALGYSLSVNGKYDIPTHQAVVAFQQRNGLTITGVANPATQAAIFASGAKPYSTKVSGIGASEGKGGGPSTSQVKLLHWFDDVKKSASGGQYATVYHPGSDSSFKVRFYSMGNHADSEPATWRDTQIMNRAFGTPSWNINTVYVKLPDGRWTLAAMHNRPHLTGAVSANGFGGHLCIHFLRDTAEVNRNDPDYGASNQRAIRKAWQSMTGEVVE